jgi:hypothetical protein
MGLVEAKQLSRKILDRVVEYVPLDNGETLLLLYEDTLFNTATNGLIVTDRRIVKYEKHVATSIPFTDLAKLQIEGSAELTQKLTVVGWLSGSFSQNVVLGPRLEELLAPIRERVAEGIVQIDPHANAGTRFSAAS